MTGLNSAAFNALFDSAHRSVFRWEAHPLYAVPGDDASMAAFRAGTPRPERSVRTSPWLRRIAVQSTREVEPVDWWRVRVMGDPLSEYDHWSLLAYVESQAAGEQVRVIDPGRLESDDFWLIDAGTPHAVAVVMHYDGEGRLLERERVTDRQRLEELAAVCAAATTLSVPLNVWLARQAAHA